MFVNSHNNGVLSPVFSQVSASPSPSAFLLLKVQNSAGKTRTALLETRTAKSMRFNYKNSLLLQNLVLFRMSDESENSERILLSRRTVRSRTTSVANSLRKHRKKVTLLTKKEFTTSQKPTTSKQPFRMNCPIINLWNKLTVLRRNLFHWKASKNSLLVKNRKKGNAKKTKYNISLT